VDCGLSDPPESPGTRYFSRSSPPVRAGVRAISGVFRRMLDCVDGDSSKRRTRSILGSRGHVWSKGSFVSTTGINEAVIRHYMEMPGQEDTGQAQLDLG
jgi:hypothetical protein